VATAWSFVTSDTIEHCFSKAGFGVVDLSKNVEDEKAEEEDWKKVSYQAVTFTEFVNCDNNVMTTALLSVEDICDAASEDKDMREESDDLDEE
jgi:hypothetical protein